MKPIVDRPDGTRVSCDGGRASRRASTRLLSVTLSFVATLAMAEQPQALPMVPMSRATVLSLLKDVPVGDGEAGRMLASLSENAPSPGADSIRLYLLAQKAGNQRAVDRLAILRQQGVAIPFSAGFGDSLPDDGDIVPMGRMDDPMTPGYHCHFLRPGQMWCHSGLD